MQKGELHVNLPVRCTMSTTGPPLPLLPSKSADRSDSAALPQPKPKA